MGTPSNNGGSQIVKYNMYRKEENGNYIFLGPRDPQYLTFRDWSVTLGKKYYYKITAVNTVGESDPSNEKDIMVSVLVKTTANLNVRSSPSLNGSILVTLPPNVYGLAIGGPIMADNYYWWYCFWNYNNSYYYGWSVENYLWFYSGPLSLITNYLLSSKIIYYEYSLNYFNEIYFNRLITKEILFYLNKRRSKI